MRIIGFVLGYLGLPRGVEGFNYTKTVRVKTVKNQKRRLQRKRKMK